jgi:hypothetical protein
MFNHADFTTGVGPVAVAVGDFNGDDKLDIATISGFDNAVVSVPLGLGDGTFKPYVTTTAGTQGGSIAVGDFNGDGKLDVVISDNQAPSLGADVMLGNGNGTFQAPVKKEQSSPVNRALALTLTIEQCAQTFCAGPAHAVVVFHSLLRFFLNSGAAGRHETSAAIGLVRVRSRLDHTSGA